MSNFSFIANKTEYALFAPACLEAERIYAAAPALCAVGCRKALELAVKWVYAADTSLQKPYRDNLSALIHEPGFREALEPNTWAKLQFILKAGNLAVHTERRIAPCDALLALRSLFEFILWIDYCYGGDYSERHFEESLIPTQKIIPDTQKIKEQESLLQEKDSKIEELQKQIAQFAPRYTEQKEEHKKVRSFHAEDISEFKTRKNYIDVDLKQMGWNFDGSHANIKEEVPVENMAGIEEQKGYCDYVLFSDDGLPLAVVEAKRTSKDPKNGQRQAELYADCLYAKYKRMPLIFLSNGFETWFWDKKSSPLRKVSGIFSKEDMQKCIISRENQKNLLQIPINKAITDRYYQIGAVRAVLEHMEKGERKHLLVMATGTGKTRTAASLVDMLSRGEKITNVLFLADRTALVNQAERDFKKYLSTDNTTSSTTYCTTNNTTYCNLCSDKKNKNARIVFSTYPTILNALDTLDDNGQRFYTPAHFDLIIIDESHRSIFKKYRAIFEYFDAMLLGLTATPKTDIDRNTYDFFEMEQNVPTYVYDYETAVNEEFLVPYYNYEVKTKFLDDGIHYDELSAKDKERYEEDFTEDEYTPEYIPSEALNKFVFNENTVNLVLQDLMEKGIHTASGDRLGKTIIFAQNKRHTDFIIECFNKLYPQYNGEFARRIICDDMYAQTLIDDFKQAEKAPHIAVSVDMLDTGIDVPEIVNLVFFKKIRSKIKFWQMIGRGTRLCKNLFCMDQIDGEYTDKRRFLIFDYCTNFEFFREHKEGYEATETKSLTELIFIKQIKLISALQESAYTDKKYQIWRKGLATTCHQQISALNPDLTAVKLQLQYVAKFQNKNAFICLNEGDKGELITNIAPLVWSAEQDEAAKQFDNLMYTLILNSIEQLPAFGYTKTKLCSLATQLERKITIPQIQDKLPRIQEINTDDFWTGCDILQLENIRKELRGLICFLDDETKKDKQIFTNLNDSILETTKGNLLYPDDNFENYKAKVNRYVNEHQNTLAIYNLTHNIPLTKKDYQELERVFTCELGSKEDYAREYGNTPFGLLIRKIAKLDNAAIQKAFSAFINDEALNTEQINFIHKLINYIAINGYMEDTKITEYPFDKPAQFTKLFDYKTQIALIQTINQITKNAIEIKAS